ncbi:MAG: translation initiation factor IF-2 [Candidatus Mycalebacterium zealandia]|nr:MAG: translation initiation factor IF-2 [Candidatus Mycalebacterium zealandia]
MKPTRVHELAKELGVSSKEVMVAANDMGVNLSTASNTVDLETVEKLRRAFSSSSKDDKDGEDSSKNEIKVVKSKSGDVTETRGAKRVVRRRKKQEKREEEESAAPEAEAETEKTSAQTKSAPQEKAEKEKPTPPDPEKEQLARQIQDSLAPKLVVKKKEYVVDEKSFRRKQDIRRKKLPHHHSSSAAKQVKDYPPVSKKSVKIGETITLEELARRMDVKLRDVRGKAKSIGLNASPKDSIDYETATLVAAEYGLEVDVDRFDEAVFLDDKDAGFSDEAPRPPVVSVMGHVDHGKTTLLDNLRKSNVALGEAGGITQHIGAYKVSSGNGTVVFIDTPGHESFTSMRARGAKINDMAILVVAADDGVKAQTIEAINHAKAADVPAIVAINKIDKDAADSENVKRQLSEHGLVTEEWGGDTLFVEISAKTGQGLKELLELLLLQADILELRAPQKGLARGIVLESRLDKGRGALANVIVTKGDLKVGDYVVAGLFSGKVKALSDENGAKLKSAGPSIPVEVMGLSGVPEAGENLYVLRDEKTARAIIENRKLVLGQSEAPQVPHVSQISFDALEDAEQEAENSAKELSIIIKSDTRGTVEAIKDSIDKIDQDKCSVKIVHSGVGGISGTDVELANVTNASILGFNVRPDSKAASDASENGILVETYPVVYELIDRIKRIMEGLLDPLVEEETLGHARVMEIFRMSGQRAIAGCFVDDGKVLRGENIRVVRDGSVVYESKVGSLKRFKDDVKEVQSGFECGLTIENFSDVKVGDVLEVYLVKETAQQL